MAPILVEIARDQAGRLDVTAVRLDDALDLARRFEILTLPTLIVFVDGEPARRVAGPIGKPQLLEMLDEFVAQ
jgi:thioredoxin 1